MNRPLTIVVNSGHATRLQLAAQAIFAIAPLAIVPMGILLLGSDWPDWKRMAGVAIGVFAAAKWMSFADFLWPRDGRRVVTLRASRIAGYFLLWPGMDPRPFFAASADDARPKLGEWLWASGKLLVGVATIIVAAQYTAAEPILAGWAGIAGFLLALHFGTFHLLSLGWRAAGIAATPIMNGPLASTSVADLWGRRWNLAFRDLAHRFVFRPTVAAFGPAVATLLVFLMSGLAHDAVVSLPVSGGYGGPTAYFLIQGIVMLGERSRAARRIGLGRGFTGWAFTMLVVVAPAPLLFHRAFVERAMVPLLDALPI